MSVTYNKINWDEVTPITVANLDRIDVGIDEVVTQSNSNESRITTNEGDISSNEDRITTNEDDISSNEDRITTNEDDISKLLKVFLEGTWEPDISTENVEISYFVDATYYNIRLVDKDTDTTLDYRIDEITARADVNRFITLQFDQLLDGTYFVAYKIWGINLP